MIEIGSTIINTIFVGNTTPNKIDVGDTQVWPDGSGPTPPSHTYVFTMDPDVETTFAYTGDTIVIGIRSTCDGSPQELSYFVQQNGQTPNWIHLLQRQEHPYDNYNYVYYFALNTNTGSVRHAGFTFTQSGSNTNISVSITQQAFTNAFDGLDIKATRATSDYGYWVIGTSDNGMGGPPPYYQQKGVVIATDKTITSPKNVTYTLSVSRYKSLSNSGLGKSTITKTITQFISPGSQVTPVSGGKMYNGKYVIIPDTKWVEGTGWVAEAGTNTTLSPHPSQDVSNVSITNVTTP